MIQVFSHRLVLIIMLLIAFPLSAQQDGGENATDNDAGVQESAETVISQDEQGIETPTGETEAGISEGADNSSVAESEDADLSEEEIEVIEEQRPEPRPRNRPRPEPVEERNVVPVVRPELSDAWDDNFKHRRLSGYILKERGQISAAIDEPILQDGTEIITVQTEDGETAGKSRIEFKGSIWDLVAWLSIILIFVFIFILYNMRNGKRRRKVFRNIPSQKKNLRNNYTKYNRY